MFRFIGRDIKLSLYILSILFCLSACTENSPSRSDPKVTLRMRHVWVAEHDWIVRQIFEDIIDEFMKCNPSVSIIFEGMEQELHRQQILKAEMVTGTPPDVFVLWGGSELDPYIRAGRMLDLTSLLERLGLSRKFIDLSMWTREGHVYGLPLEGFSELVYYNTKIFDEVGISVPHNTDDFLHACEDLIQAGIQPIALGNRDKWPAAMIFQYCLNRAGGLDLLNKVLRGDLSWDNEYYKRGTDFFTHLVRIGAFGKNANTLKYEEQGELFLEGKAAMIITGSWETARFSRSIKSSDIGVFPFPAMPGGLGAQNDICAGYTLGLGFSGLMEGAKKATVEKFIQYIFTEFVQRRYLFEAGRLPSMRFYYDTYYINNPLFAAVYKETQMASSSWPAYDAILSPGLNQRFNDVVQSLIDGQSSESALGILDSITDSNMY